MWDVLTPREQGYLVGLFLGDGSIFIKETTGTYRIRFCLSKSDSEIIIKISKILQMILNPTKLEYTKMEKAKRLLKYIQKN